MAGFAVLESNDPRVAGPLGSLALSVVQVGSPVLTARALRWHASLARLGVAVPLFFAHDLGLVMAAPREQTRLARRAGVGSLLPDPTETETLLGAYEALIAEVADGDVAAGARHLRLHDDLVVALLAQLIAAVLGPLRSPYPVDVPVDFALLRDLEALLPTLLSAVPRDFELGVLRAVQRGRLHLLTLIDTLDVDTLRLVGMLGPEVTTAGALTQVDLLAALTSPSTSAIVRFSLELLPSVLEPRPARGAGLHAVLGYSGVSRRGSLDSLVLTELAWDAEEFHRRLLDDELLFFTREDAPEPSRRLFCLLIDASASMRGDRQVFARGLAIALAKRLDLSGKEVSLRFFDSRLYEVQRVRGGHLPLAYVLGFKSERGRNPARVFAQLATELALVRRRARAEPVVYLVTHAELHVPRSLVADIRAVARLIGVFILPSGGSLDLDYLDLLDAHTVVDHDTLAQRAARVAVATRIVEGASRLASRP